MSPHKRRLLPWIALGVIYVVWGSTYLAIAVVVKEQPPMAAAALRFLTAGLVMTAIAAVVDRKQPRPTGRQVADYAFVGVLLLGFGNGFVMWAEKYIPSGIAALIVATVPLWMTLLDGLRAGGERWTLRGWVGIGVGLLGVALIARPEGSVSAGHWWAIGALQVATIAWTIGSLYAQGLPKRLPLFSAAAVEMVAGGLAMLVQSWMFREDWSGFAAASARSWWALGYLTVFGSLIAFTSYAYCLNELPASTVGTYAYVNPVVAVLLGHLVLSERLSPSLLVGALLIVAAVALTTLRKGAPESPPVPATAAD